MTCNKNVSSWACIKVLFPTKRQKGVDSLVPHMQRASWIHATCFSTCLQLPIGLGMVWLNANLPFALYALSIPGFLTVICPTSPRGYWGRVNRFSCLSLLSPGPPGKIYSRKWTRLATAFALMIFWILNEITFEQLLKRSLATASPVLHVANAFVSCAGLSWRPVGYQNALPEPFWCTRCESNATSCNPCKVHDHRQTFILLA